jgi:ABC-2 type transport system ATP-binding protein
MSSIVASHLKCSFGAFVALHDVSFRVSPGEMFALLGPNGAGKSTTLSVLTTVLPPTSGEVAVAGFDVVEDSHQVRRNIAVLFQDETLDQELTVVENFELHASFYGIPGRDVAGRIRELLEDCGLWDRRSSVVKTLSIGTRRRLEAARTFLTEPEVIFLDEPTVGMDAQSRHWFWSRVRKAQRDRNTTVLFATHYLEEASREATRVAIIDGGRIIAEGTCAQLMAQSGCTSLEQAYMHRTGTTFRDANDITALADESAAISRAKA